MSETNVVYDFINNPPTTIVLLKDIELYLSCNEELSVDNSRIYFLATFDSSQTEFERKFNKLEIGVIAETETAAAVLIALLREDTDDFEYMYTNIKNDILFLRPDLSPTRVTLEQVIEVLAERTKDQLFSFLVTDTFTTKSITKTFEDLKEVYMCYSAFNNFLSRNR